MTFKKVSIPAICAALLAAVSLLFIFGPFLHLLGREPVQMHVSIVHHTYLAASVVSLPVVGAMLLYASIFVYQRHMVAVILSGGMSIALLGYLALLYPHGRVTILVAILISLYCLLAAVGRKQFAMRNNMEGIMQRVRRIAIIAAIGIIYGVIGFFFFGHALFHERFSFIASLDLALDSLTGFSGTLVEPTRRGQLFIDSLGGIGIMIFILLLNTLFRPLRIKYLSHESADRHKAAAIVQHSSRSSEDFFKLWPEDKQYYFSPNGTSFIAYKPSGHTVVALGDPVGKRQEFPALVRQFIRYCESLGWSVAAINTSPEGQRLYEKAGLSSLFVGNEGVVAIAEFMKTTKTNKHFRYVANKARRDHLVVEEWTDLTRDQLSRLRHISRDWLGRDGRREYTFFMGYFDDSYLRKSRVFVLLQDGEPVGYTNVIPSYADDKASIDQLRGMGVISSVGMHFLLANVIETLHSEGVATLNIGLSPLSGIDEGQADLLSRLVLRIVRTLGTSYYSFGGLEQFKNKFKPEWIRQSVVYSGAPTNLVRITHDIEHASSYGSRKDHVVTLSTATGIIVLTFGLYLILG